MTEPQRLVRASDNAMIAGVCAGIARYFGWDPTLVRVAWALITIFTAIVPGIVAYVVLWFVMPLSTSPPPAPTPTPEGLR